MKAGLAARIETAVFFSFLALLFLLPWPWGSNRPWVWLPEAGAALTLLLITLWLPGTRAAIRDYRPARALFLALALWWLFGWLQVVPLPGVGSLSLDPFSSALRALQSTFYIALFLLVVRLARSPHRLRRIAQVMVCAGLAQALYGALMTLSGVEWLVMEPKTYGRGLATGTFVNRNHLAGLLEICLALGVGLLVAQMRGGDPGGGLRSRTRDILRWILSGKMVLRLSLIVMVVALVLTHSRMGNVAFFVSLLVTSGLALAVMKNPPRPLVWLLLSLLAVDVLLVGTWFGVDQVVERLAETGQYDAGQQTQVGRDRFDLSAETLRAWRDHAWFGSGGGTFEHLFPAYRPADLPKVFDHAHNDYAELMLEYGVLGVLPLAAFVVLALREAFLAQRQRHNPLMRGLGFAAVMAVIAMGLHSLVDFNLHIPANAAYLTVALALGVAARRVSSRSTAR